MYVNTTTPLEQYKMRTYPDNTHTAINNLLLYIEAVNVNHHYIPKTILFIILPFFLQSSKLQIFPVWPWYADFDVNIDITT
jgi:hypothetical protein